MPNREVVRFAEVAVDAPAGHDRTFSYSIPPSLDAKIGQLVIVPFGPRKLQGLVVSLPDSPQVPETREVFSVDDSGPILTETQLRLAHWVSAYYMCSLFEAAAPMLPPGGRFRIKTYLAPGPRSSGDHEAALTPYQEEVLDYILSKGRMEEGRLVDALGERARAAARRLAEAGLVERTQARAGALVKPQYRDYVQLPANASRSLEQRLAELDNAPRQQAALSRLLETRAPLMQSPANKEFGRSAIMALLSKGMIERVSIATERDPLEGRVFPADPRVTLTSDQSRTTSEVRRSLAGEGPRTFLLEGVTGSGKTEVYLDAVRECLKLGKRAIVMVPEISLTPQTVERFASRFPGKVAVLHSGLAPGERFDQWWKVRRGEYGVVVGSRSAVFAPQPDLGLVVIDEEHEWTYKQHDTSPRYHARAVALKLAELTGAVVLLGSASPDVQSYRRAQRGGVRLLQLPERIVDDTEAISARRTRGGLAPVQVVDMREELREGNRHIFSRALRDALTECVAAGSQAILFLNRRGSSSHVQCRACGLALQCQSCDVAMAYHRDIDRLLCHYCGNRRIPPPRCPGCLSYGMAYHGIGTKTVVDEAVKLLPGTSVMRWDRDAVTNARAHQELLDRFRSEKAQILVGTQMIAKGLHFPSVTLVGVVLADVGLGVPDFRSGERTFQLLYQVAGRSGRGAAAGRVIVQTYQPGNYAIKAAAAQDYRLFYDQEIDHRREHRNPPFTRLARLSYSNVNGAKCELEVQRLHSLLSGEQASWGISDVEILGPTPAHPARLRGHYRWQLVLRGTDPRVLLDKVTIPHGWDVDIDPVGLG
jgi:primosomal protein N' (replication factor Y)